MKGDIIMSELNIHIESLKKELADAIKHPKDDHDLSFLRYCKKRLKQTEVVFVATQEALRNHKNT